MTSQSPRIYTYKITFEEVPYYYYGVKKEKKYNEEYWGSPVTNKWCWELYTPKKQILELFEFDDGGYIKAQEIEKRLIKPVLNDKCCLNENVGGITSLKISRETALKNWREGKGLASISLEKRKEVASKTGKKLYEEGGGCFSLTPEKRKKVNEKTNKKLLEERKGIHSITAEKRKEINKKSNETNKRNNIGIYSRTKEDKIESGKNWGKIGSKKTNSQKWMCSETGYITTSGPLSIYQRKRGIDTSKRKRIE
jgi:hypothetical protein